MNEITAVDWFAFGGITVFILMAAFYGMKVYVDDSIRKAKREVKRELR